MSTEKLLTERSVTHGDYGLQAVCAQRFKLLAQATPNWEDLPLAQKESLEMIFTKISRILHGDFNNRDHYADIAGYARLICSPPVLPSDDPTKPE